MNNQILIVEDDIVFCKMLTTFLNGKQFTVNSAQTVAAAMTALQKNSYQFAIIDQRLPDGQGLDIIKTIKKDSPATKTILMSRFLDEILEADGKAIGVDAFIKKPIQPNDLLQLLH